jgi:hypothetical protein
MSFAEHRTTLAAQLTNLEDLLRQAQNVSRTLEERAASAAPETDTFADDTAVASVAAAAKRARQELGALLRTVGSAKGQLGG